MPHPEFHTTLQAVKVLCIADQISVMTAPSSIVLVGPTGAGKSSIGRLLAQALQWRFTDLDREIESRVGVCISTLFTQGNEAYFREQEHLALRDTIVTPAQVLATGAGCVVREENRKLLHNAYVVHLQVPLASQLKRLQCDRSRPLLQSENREQILQEMARIRAPYYAEVADLTFCNDGHQSPRSACAKLLTQIKQNWHD